MAETNKEAIIKNGVDQKKQQSTISYATIRIVGNGSFGVVFQASVIETGEVVAIKKVFQDKRFKNRELQIMRKLNHPNIVLLKHCFYSDGEKPDDLYLNLVLEYVPNTVYRISKSFRRLHTPMPMLYVKLYVYQLCRSVAYIHACGICHRDIKPQNLLLDEEKAVLKLCDFGSAKSLIPGKPSVAYICSRYYRAPELIFGSTEYTTAIDIWSLGCVFAELLLGRPLFPGESEVNQLVEIIKVLGPPSRAQIAKMNPSYVDFNFPDCVSVPWNKVFQKTRKGKDAVPEECVDLIDKLLQYAPNDRITPLEACAHPFFDELRDPTTRLPNGNDLPPLFHFTSAEYEVASEKLRETLVPEFARNSDNWPPEAVISRG
eukprot:TRINITY_DN781801_c0_g1_i1.p1 TRINITY_DN781801_c0_g1~~TRINITY_DN781801_c0_g1_i1.p1  ORF type:complete len:374 (+),score=91.23 TRINITY_DN781801_c0_g1_i1:86-1207(+)